MVNAQLLYLNFLTLRYTHSFCCSGTLFAREKVQATIHFVPGPFLKHGSYAAKMFVFSDRLFAGYQSGTLALLWPPYAASHRPSA
jgi:hypothetical protein